MTFIKRINKGKHTYLAEVKSVRKDGKVRHQFIRYVGKEVDNKTILSGDVNRAQVTKVSVYGPLITLHSIAERLNLPQILGEESPYLLSLAYAHCIEPGSLVSIQKWFERTDLNHILSLENITYDKLLHALDSLMEEPKVIQRRMFRSAQETFQLQPKGLFYDVTNVYFYGCKCPIAKKGHNKEKLNKEQVQIGLAVTKDEKIPLFHKVYEGNIHDARTFQDIFDEFDAYYVKNVTVVWDRGITSKDNITDALHHKMDVICGLPLKQKVKEDVISFLASAPITRFHNRVELKSVVFYAEQRKYSYQGIAGYLTVCFNKKAKLYREEDRRKRIHKALQLLKKKPIPSGLKQYIRYRKLNEDALEEAERLDGVSAIFSTKKIETHEVIKAYFEKDTVEKAFRSLKSTLEIRPIRHWLSERVKSHIFICFIAYYLMSILEYQMQPLNITATQALDQLKTMYRVHLTDPKTKNTFVKTVTLIKEQEKILRLVDKKLLKKCSQ